MLNVLECLWSTLPRLVAFSQTSKPINSSYACLLQLSQQHGNNVWPVMSAGLPALLNQVSLRKSVLELMTWIPFDRIWNAVSKIRCFATHEVGEGVLSHTVVILKPNKFCCQISCGLSKNDSCVEAWARRHASTKETFKTTNNEPSRHYHQYPLSRNGEVRWIPVASRKSESLCINTINSFLLKNLHQMTWLTGPLQSRALQQRGRSKTQHLGAEWNEEPQAKGLCFETTGASLGLLAATCPNNYALRWLCDVHSCNTG